MSQPENHINVRKVHAKRKFAITIEGESWEQIKAVMKGICNA